MLSGARSDKQRSKYKKEGKDSDSHAYLSVESGKKLRNLLI
jgi:hypothetical protein